MEIKVPQSLIDLDKLFCQNGCPLYLVGGFVRNAILGFCETDMDVCSSMMAEEVLKMLKNTQFKAQIVNPNLGTVLIKSPFSEDEFEHTTFRAENYEVGGKHSPLSVKFVDDIKLDASRRDFSANSIYLKISNNEIVDFYGGVEDVNSRVLRTVETPEYVFSRDGLRILRMVRIACELDFTIDEECFLTAKKLVKQLADISQERFNKEIVSILFSDYKYDNITNPYSPVRGLKLLTELRAWPYVLPKFTNLVGVDCLLNGLSNQDWCKNVGKVTPIHRITAFCYDMLTATKMSYTKANVSAILGQGGLMLNKDEVDVQSRLITSYTKALIGFKTTDEKRFFIQQNSDIIFRLIDFGKCFGGKLDDIMAEYEIMKIDNVPISLKDLKINGNDIFSHFPAIEKRNYSKILNNLLKACCVMPELNTKENLLNYIKKGN